MLKAIIRTTACLAVSATAFIVITKMDATAAKPRSPSVPESSEPKPAPSKPAPPAPAPPAPKLTVAILKTPPPAAAATSPKKNDEATGEPLPNWKGKRLSLARREARTLGLKVTAVDESGETVPAAMAGIYRVRRQLAQTDAAVQFVVREIVDTASGY